MPKVSPESAQHEDVGVVEKRSGEVAGYSVDFVTFRQDLDASPLLKGLPDDQCQCPHWGYVLSGRLTYRVAGHEEVFEAGDAFYLPPGHVPVGNEPNSQLVQFSPAKELRQVEDVMRTNMEAMGAART